MGDGELKTFSYLDTEEWQVVYLDIRSQNNRYMTGDWLDMMFCMLPEKGDTAVAARSVLRGMGRAVRKRRADFQLCQLRYAGKGKAAVGI